MLRLTASFFCLVAGASSDDAAEYHPTSCVGLEDGVQWVRPLMGRIEADDYENFPSIQVRCSDGYMILDYSLDSNIASYFSSFWVWTDDAASSTLADRVTWTDWFLPYATDTSELNFRTSEDCQTCSSSDEYQDFSAWFMTGNYIGCMWATKAYCDMDQKTLECYTCVTPASEEETSGLCTHMELSAGNEVYEDHVACVSSKWNAVPSLGVTGKYCTCVKPVNTDTQSVAALYNTDVSQEASDAVREEKDEAEQQEDSSETRLVELTNEDFKYGTLRISRAGTYRIMEDIEFNMNAPDNFDAPNDVGNWWPRTEQSDDYSGADGSFVGPYSMGFFAGISVECDDVVIDLNGFTLSQSKYFYLQQRFFSLIELSSKPFVSGQGPGNFGGKLLSGSNIVIKNGNLGLSSHHGIHGNYATDITIKDVKIKNFEVGGIGLNGFENLHIENVEVGPNYEDVPVTGLYTQGRFMLERMRAVVNTGTEETVSFAGREKEYTASDITDELEKQMDMAFEYAFDIDANYDLHDLSNLAHDDLLSWAASSKEFVNPRGIPVGATVYGIYLNAQGADVFGVGQSPGTSSNAVLKNVKIQGLRNEPWETVRYRLNRGPFNDLMDLTSVSSNGLDERSSAKYLGSAYSDAQAAINALSTDWGVLGHSLVTAKVSNWIFTGGNAGGSESTLTDDDPIYCNADVMLHVVKGIFGLRMDSIEQVDIDNLEIKNLHNLGFLGNDICGEYWKSSNGGHHNQNYPIQTGYTGTEVHAMTFIKSTGSVQNVVIDDVVSARGDARGLQLFPGNELEIGDVSVSNIHAGAYLAEDELSAPYLPNKQPRACAFDMWAYFSESDSLYENSITFTEGTSVRAKCVTMHADSCSYDFDYITNVLDADNTDDDVFVDTAGNGWNFEYVGEVDACDAWEPETLPQKDVISTLSKMSDYHMETLKYLQHQDEFGMRAVIDTSAYLAASAANEAAAAEVEMNENDADVVKIKDEEADAPDAAPEAPETPEDDGNYDRYPKQWPSDESLSWMAWFLLVTIILTTFLVLGCIIYQKFATYDLYRSIVGSDASCRSSLDAYLNQGKYSFLQASDASGVEIESMNGYRMRKGYAGGKVYLGDDSGRKEHSPLLKK